ncbi:MAG: lycopene cyclase domain-containing protein [Bacteriovorax sp.]|nr:lycopene cyclase domain-containing protein [Bacteriovorax sp.]
MTYLQFLILFMGIPLSVLITKYISSDLPNKKEFQKGIIILIFLAVFYTTPWDNYLVMTGVWSYGSHRILGTIGYVPIEEYCFFILQPIFSGLLCFLMQKKFAIKKEAEIFDRNYQVSFVSFFYGALFLIGVAGLNFEKTRYFGLILSWAMPVILLQWLVGGSRLLANRKIFLTAVFVPTLYLWIADTLAISDGIWTIPATYSTGLKVGGLPIEESLFFLVTNLMLAQGLILFVVMKQEMNKLLDTKRRILKWIGLPG